MEARRLAESDDEEWESLRRGWCLGSDEFKTEMLEKMETHLGENHAGELKRQTAEAKAERIIAEELRRLGWTPSDLKLRTKSDPAKLQMASRLRAETTLSVSWIAQRLHFRNQKKRQFAYPHLEKISK